MPASLKVAGRYLASTIVVLLIILLYRLIHVSNLTTVALTFLLAVLIVSTLWRLDASVFMAIVAAVAVERARALENLSRTEAARESEQLRSVLLDSVTHEFRTPLTAIKASVTSLLSHSQLNGDQQRELLNVINEESDRLNRLVGEAAEMAQLEANKVELHLAPHALREALDPALEGTKQTLGKHPVEVRLPANLPRVRMDVSASRRCSRTCWKMQQSTPLRRVRSTSQGKCSIET